MVAAGEADGGVGGAVNTTAETARAALQNIGLAEGIRRFRACFSCACQTRDVWA